MNHKTIHPDKRLHILDQERLECLTSLADRLSKSPEDQRMTVFLSIMQEMRAKNLTFTPVEQDLLFTVLTENLSPQEKKKAEMIRRLSSQLTKK